MVAVVVGAAMVAATEFMLAVSTDNAVINIKDSHPKHSVSNIT